MPSSADAERADAKEPMHPGDSPDGQKSYRVLLEDVASGIETADSFAIKFSLLTKTPISKTKLLVNHLPARIWSGQGRSRAEHILALIEEAGGRGSIVEAGSAPPASAAVPTGPDTPDESKTVCRLCGFPMKEEETRCGFCMTPVGEPAKSEPPPELPKKARSVSRKRVICYACVLAAGITIITLLSR